MARVHALIAEEAELIGRRLVELPRMVLLRAGQPPPSAQEEAGKASMPGMRHLSEAEQKRMYRSFGSSRIILGGFGQGGALALYSSVNYKHRLGGVISFSGFAPCVGEMQNTFMDLVNKELARSAPAAASAATPSASRATNASEQGKPRELTPQQFAVGCARRLLPNLTTPILAVHGLLDEAVPLRFATGRYAQCTRSPLGMKIELREQRDMAHFMANEQLFGLESWVQGRVKAMH